MPMRFQKKCIGESEEDFHSKRMIEQAETTEELLQLAYERILQYPE